MLDASGLSATAARGLSGAADPRTVRGSSGSAHRTVFLSAGDSPPRRRPFPARGQHAGDR
jgi:hypothetical protein